MATETEPIMVTDPVILDSTAQAMLAELKKIANNNTAPTVAAQNAEKSAADAATSAANAAKNAATGIEAITGKLANLNTSAKGNLVAAINEVKQDIADVTTGSHANAWGVILNPNSANAPLETVGNYALWTEFKERMGRYLLSNDGSKAIKLDTQDSTKYVDGVTTDETKGHVLTWVPDLYYRVDTAANGNVTIWLSESPIGGHAIHTSGEGHGSWIGSYIGRVVDGKLVSRRGLNPTRDKTISLFFSYAQANGPEFGLSDYRHRQLMLLLYLSEYHNENSQAMLGYGMNGNVNNWVACVYNALTGDTATLGDSCGKVDFTAEGQTAGAQANHVSLFGIEDPYGWYWEMIQGCYFGNSDNEGQSGSEMFLYEGNRMPSSAELTTHPAGDYRQLVRPTSSNSVYALQMGEHFDVLPAKLGSGGWGDYYWANATGQLLLWGGDAYGGSLCGLVFSGSVSAWSYATSSIAARLAYYGQPTIVTRESEL